MWFKEIFGRIRNDLGLQILTLYSLFIIPIVIGALFFDGVAGENLRDEIISSDLALAQAIAQETDTFIENALIAVSQLSKYPEIIQAENNEMLDIFRYFQAGRPDVNLIYRLAGDGIMLAHYPIGPISTVGTDFSFREYFQRAEETDKAFISLGRISPTTEEPVATAVQPIWLEGVFSGVVATNIKLQSLSYTLASITSDYENNSGLQVVIIDRAGKVIANPDPSYLLIDFLSLQPKLSEEVLAGHSDSFITNDQDGVETLYSYVPVPSAGWGVIVSRPTSIAFATPISFHQGVLLMIGVFSGIGIFFWLVLSLRVLSPLEKLAAYSHQVGRRQSISNEKNLLDELSDRHDQIGHLVRSLRRMEKAIQSRFNELATLVETSQAVVSSLDSQVVLNRILEQVERLLGIRKSAIVALDKSKGVFFAKASRGLSARYAEGLIIKPDEADSVTLRAIRTGEPIIIQDTMIDPSFAPFRPRAEAEGYRSFAAIPLQSIHAAPAALVLYSPTPHLFTENNVDLLVNFANQAAMAIENAELYANSDARLQDQTRRLEALIQSLDVGLVLEDLDGKVLYVNRSVSDMVKVPDEILIGSPVINLYETILADSPSYEEDLSKVETLLSMEIEQDISLSIMVKSALRYYRLKGFTVNDSTGTLLGRGQILQDITKDYEIDRMKSGLISTVSHELRTPLAAIKGYATTLLAEDVIWERKAQTEFIQIISDESDRLGELVNDLLDMSRIEAGNLRLSLRFCNLSEIIYKGVSRAYPDPGERIVYEIPEELSLVRGDPQRLEVVIRNLVENAIKYADNDLPIAIRVDQGEEQVIIRIEDQGPGIPLQHQKDVFQSFYRMEDGLTRRTPGVGLGLAISRGFIAAHEGQIWLEPREVGTCVAFSLPISDGDIFDTDGLPERMEQK